MQEAKDKMYEYLLTIANGKLTLNPEQLEKVIDISPKQQSVLRQKNIFPIPYKKIGKLIHYPITAVINYLVDGETDVVDQPAKVQPKSSTPKKSASKKDVRDLSHIFLMKNFSLKLQAQAKQAEELATILNKVADINKNYTELKQELNH